VNTTTRSSYAILGATRGIGPNQTKAAFDTFAEMMRQKYPRLREVSAEEVLQGKADAFLTGNDWRTKFALGIAKRFHVIVAVTENYPLPGVDFDQKSQPEVLRRLVDKARDRLIVVALRDPYELTTLPEVPTYLCAFSFRPCSAQAAAEVLCGEIAPLGQTSVSIPSTTYAARENIIT
jgi:beta-N-acetylhexosaminidase